MRTSWKWCAAVLLAASLTFAQDSNNAKQGLQDVAPVKHEPNPPNSKQARKAHYVVMVSLDGFRWDYAAKWGATHLQQMAAEGASATEGMLPSYPSVTFPNHYTIVTGLYPEHHGIVDNVFLDPKRNYEEYYYKEHAKNSDGSWYGGVPLWSLAEQQGMRSASMFWVGSEAEIAGKRPSYWVPFDDKFDDEKRIDQIMIWLGLPEAERPHMITLYYSNVDHAGHINGPDAPETGEAVRHVDGLIGELEEKIKATKLPVDLIVVSDHGMVKLDDRKWVALDQLANMDGAKSADGLMYPTTEAEKQRIYEELKAKKDPRFAVYRLKDMPERLHYNANEREGDPVVEPLKAVPITVHAKTAEIGAKGEHGWDPAIMPEMKAIFYAEGPDIKAGVKLQPFENVNIYDFVAGILGLNPAKNDGDAQVLRPARR
jgi:predicted AlkP superfamily pyrophosphatase or phosphodiesterase